MNTIFTFPEFRNRFPADDLCLDEIKKMRYPSGIYCTRCKEITKHYKLTGRNAYSCQACRSQTYPLVGTIFERTTTPLRLWFYAFFLMTHTRAQISAKQLQRELGVTYKTAWKIRKQIQILMAQTDEALSNTGKLKKVHKWVFFNKFQITLVEKKEAGR